jgi:uncharacterized protein YqhQ
MAETEVGNRKLDMESPKEHSHNNTRDTSLYGGQAVIEGVLMKGKHRAVVACRNPKGEIVSKVLMDDPEGKVGKGIRRWPFLRGFLILVDSISLGLKALTFSAEVTMPEDEKAKAEPEYDTGNPDGEGAE